MKPSPSRLDRAKKCRFWLRSDVRPQRAPRTKDQDRGLSIHSAIERGLSLEEAVAEGVPAEPFVSWLASGLADVPWLSEAPILYDAEACLASTLPKLREEWPDLTETEIAMIPDLVFLPGEGDEPTIRIVDVKTGWQEDLPKASESLQLRAYALAIATLHGTAENLDDVEISICHLKDNGEPAFVDSHLLTESDLDEMAAWLNELIDTPDDEPPVPGAHCHLPFPCPALETECPVGFGSMAAALRLGGPDLVGLKVNGETVGNVLQVALAAEKAAKGLVARARAWMDAEEERTGEAPPIDIGVEGKAYQKHVRRSEAPGLSDEALAVFAEFGVESLIRQETKVSKADVSKKLGAKRMREFMARLREVDGVEVSESTRYELKKVKP